MEFLAKSGRNLADQPPRFHHEKRGIWGDGGIYNALKNGHREEELDCDAGRIQKNRLLAE